MVDAVPSYETNPKPGDRAAALSSILVGLLSAVALLVGMLLMARLGGVSGQSLGDTASGLLFQEAAPLLLAAETVKLASAAALAVLVWRTAQDSERKWLLLVPGIGAALLGAAGGLVGFQAVFAQSVALGETTSAIGFYGLGATGLWVLALLAVRAVPAGRWLALSGLIFALLCFAALIAAPLALLSVIVGWVWWFGLAVRLRRGS